MGAAGASLWPWELVKKLCKGNSLIKMGAEKTVLLKLGVTSDSLVRIRNQRQQFLTLRKKNTCKGGSFIKMRAAEDSFIKIESHWRQSHIDW